jgi:RNA polymerase sigma-54 factor
MDKNGFDLKESLEFVKTLKAAPVEVSVSRSDYVVPDFIITVEDDQIHIRLNQRRDVVFNSNSGVDIIVPSAHNGHRQENSFWRERYQSAKWFANALRERERNMLSAMHAIVELQKEFFLTGQFLSLRPMILKNIAERIKLDIPTVSRLLANKYAHTLFGTISLKQLFSEGVPTRDGELVSGKIVEARISSLVNEEDKKNPLTDKEITAKLCGEGFLIARRTVSKYRVRLQIPVCKMRGDL